MGVLGYKGCGGSSGCGFGAYSRIIFSRDSGRCGIFKVKLLYAAYFSVSLRDGFMKGPDNVAAVREK